MDDLHNEPLNSTVDYYQPAPPFTSDRETRFETYHPSSPSSPVSSKTVPPKVNPTVTSITSAYVPQSNGSRFMRLSQKLDRQETELSHLIGEVYGKTAQAEYNHYSENPEDFVYGLGLSFTLEFVARTILRQIEAEEETQAPDMDDTIDSDRIRAVLKFSKSWRYLEEDNEDQMAKNVDTVECLLTEIGTLIERRQDRAAKIAIGKEEDVQTGIEPEGDVDPSTAVQDGETVSFCVEEEADETRSLTITLPVSSMLSEDEDEASDKRGGVATMPIPLGSVENKLLDDNDQSGFTTQTHQNTRDDPHREQPCLIIKYRCGEGTVLTPEVTQGQESHIEGVTASTSFDDESSSSIGPKVLPNGLTEFNAATTGEDDKPGSTSAWFNWNQVPSALIATSVGSLCIAGTIWGITSALTWLRQEEEAEDD